MGYTSHKTTKKPTQLLNNADFLLSNVADLGEDIFAKNFFANCPFWHIQFP